MEVASAMAATEQPEATIRAGEEILGVRHDEPALLQARANLPMHEAPPPLLKGSAERNLDLRYLFYANFV